MGGIGLGAFTGYFIYQFFNAGKGFEESVCGGVIVAVVIMWATLFLDLIYNYYRNTPKKAKKP